MLGLNSEWSLQKPITRQLSLVQIQAKINFCYFLLSCLNGNFAGHEIYLTISQNLLYKIS